MSSRYKSTWDDRPCSWGTAALGGSGPPLIYQTNSSHHLQVTGWPVKHGRVFFSVQCTRVQKRTLDKSFFTRYQKNMAMFNWSPCMFPRFTVIHCDIEKVSIVNRPLLFRRYLKSGRLQRFFVYFLHLIAMFHNFILWDQNDGPPP